MKRQTQIKTEYPFALRPASREEAALFYSQLDEAEDTVLGTVGHGPDRFRIFRKRILPHMVAPQR